jgi:hypothetical protein
MLISFTAFFLNDNLDFCHLGKVHTSVVGIKMGMMNSLLIALVCNCQLIQLNI